ncbi:MMPL family transporter [Miltoncostaea oceani]|uniref:MMPL family transporter n=1 Tax=Miltoncostaea oceani TaxID=2843216 RepID=UPI001C3D9D39|nr:MMPL family transporter [Miltoncostaea oceani]
MSRILASLGRFAARRPLVAIAAWLVLAAVVVTAAAAFGRDLDDGFTVPGTDSDRATGLLEASGSGTAGLTAQVVVTPRDDGTFRVGGAELAAARDLRDDLARLPGVVSATDPAAAVSEDGRVAIVRLQYPVTAELDAADLDRLTGAIDAARAGEPGRALRIEAGGDLFFAFEEPDSGLGELVGVAAAAVILLVAFGSVVAMGLPILLALFGLALGVAAMPLVAHVIAVPGWAPMMAAMVGLGVGIDYALLLVTRHREHLAAGMAPVASVGLAVATAGRSVVFAGGTVLVAILGLAVAGIPFVTAAGVAISVVVLVMVAAAVTLLPALLALAGPWIDRLRIPARRRRTPVVTGARAERWATHVTRHPVRYLVAATALLVALAVPALSLSLGTPDEGTLPESRTERQAYDLVAAGFGPGANGPLLIAVDIAADEGVVGPLRAGLAADPGIARVDAPRVDREAGVATIVATPTTAPQDAATRATVERLREDVLPAALGDSPATAHVGGQTAVFLDVSGRVGDRLAGFVVAVVGLSFLLLVVVFRSVVIAVKAAILNLLGIGAAFGVLVMVFQWGWGASLIGLESTVPIVSFIPMFVFAVVFGLSMDYEVFLLSRIREHHLEGADDHAAIVRGLASTARVITAAALIMVAVFAGFVAGGDPTTKMFGLGMATAIALDATVVRMVLVPASMTLLGRANWWLPAWLDRLLPAEGAAGRPRPGAPEVVTAEPAPQAR